MDDIIDDPMLPQKAITSDRGITDRGLRKQIVDKRFPPPDANIGGRNYWLSSTYRKWKQAALSGNFAKAAKFAKTKHLVPRARHRKRHGGE